MSQFFYWGHRAWDIDCLLSDIASGTLKSQGILLHSSFSQLYGQHVIVRGSPQVKIDMRHALVAAPDNLDQPIVLLYVGQEEGIVAPFEDGVDGNSWVVGDGNHRVLAAGLHNRPLRGYVLSEDQSKIYEVSTPDFL